MGDTTAISWTHVTWNPVQGCTKVSAACKNCYMYRDKKHYGQDPTVVVRSKPQTFNRPLAKYGARATKGTPGEYKWPDGTLVFTCSWSDWFHKDADEHRPEMWDVVRQRPGLIFQILTKRADRIADHLPPDWGDGWPNVWLGVTAENQEAADERVPHLQAVPAAVRFVSVEPMLGPVDMLYAAFNGTDDFASMYSIHWVIAGCESMNNKSPGRPTEDKWLRDLRDQCSEAGAAYFLKQAVRDGRVTSRPLLDGMAHEAFPAGYSPTSEPDPSGAP